MVIKKGFTPPEEASRGGGGKNCGGCDECCRYTALQIDRPRSKRDYSDLFWHLLHEGVSIYIGHDRAWNLEHRSDCANLTRDGWCGDYENRPEICREYRLDNCTRHGEGPYYRHRFESPEDLKKYLRGRAIDFEYRRRGEVARGARGGAGGP